MKNSLAQIARSSQEAGLRSLLIGGHAVILSGVPRFTADIDFMVPRHDLGEWKSLLTKLGYRCFHETASFVQFEAEGGEFAPVDLMLVDVGTWDKLWPARREEMFADTRIFMPSVVHLVAIKLAAFSEPSRQGAAKDWDDVVGLVKAGKLDLNDPDTAALVLRYGGEDALQKLQDQTQ